MASCVGTVLCSRGRSQNDRTMTKSVTSEGRQATVSYLLDIYVEYFSDHDKFQNVIVKICIAHIVKICIAHIVKICTDMPQFCGGNPYF